ncbi:NmrA family NAD(P)-binding protein, partial [Staphylococcus aureus]
MKDILVIGATGKQGNAVVKQLLEDGWYVSALTRNKNNR